MSVLFHSSTFYQPHLRCSHARADVIALIKPQFEVTRSSLKKGIVRDEAVHTRVCAEIADFLAASGCDIVSQFPSPILGGDGNREFFVAARRP